MTKKILAILMALVLMLSMSAVAFAAEGDNEGDDENSNAPSWSNLQDVQPKVYKTYQVNNGTAPAETFTFTFTGQSYVNGNGETVQDATIPAISSATISFDAISSTETKNATLSINTNDYELGVYTYKVEETAGSTAGVTYDGTDLYLVLTILRDENSGKHFVAAMHYETATGDKKGEQGAIVNQYDSGSLSVTKQIAGNMADMTKKFAFTIEFSAPTGEVVNSTVTVTKPDGTTETKSFTDGSLTYTIDLGDNNTVKFENLPAGVTYTVSEEADGYTASQNDVAGSIEANDADTVEITNTLSTEVDTGISMDSIPYIVLLAVAAFGIVALMMKKRYEA